MYTTQLNDQDILINNDKDLINLIDALNESYTRRELHIVHNIKQYERAYRDIQYVRAKDDIEKILSLLNF